MCSVSVASSFERAVGIVVVLGDAGAHTHHVGERPVGHSLAVGETAAAVPVDVVDEPVEVLVELPREPRLADPGDAHRGDEMRGALLGGGVEELLDESQLAVSSDERRLESGGLERPATAGCDAQCAEELRCLFLALQLVHAGVLVDDGELARAAGGVAHEHRARVGCGLDPRRGVDEIAGDHALALGADRHGGLAGQHSGARGKLGRADLVSERRHGGDQVERCANGTLGVVLSCRRRSPDGHHRVADELLDRAAVAAR